MSTPAVAGGADGGGGGGGGADGGGAGGGGGDGSGSDDLFPEATAAASAVARKRKRQVKKLSRKAAKGTLSDISAGDAAECARRGVHMAARIEVLDIGVGGRDGAGDGGRVSVAALRDLLLSLFVRGVGVRWAALRNAALVPYVVVVVAHGVAAEAAAGARCGEGGGAVRVATRVYHDRASTALDRLIFGSSQSALPPVAAAPLSARTPIVAPAGMPGPEAYLLSDELRAAWRHPSVAAGGDGGGAEEDEDDDDGNEGSGVDGAGDGAGGAGEVVDVPFVELAEIAGRAPAGAAAGARPRMLAIDCEMCATSAGLELTRLTVVDEALTVVYDSYVVPERPIKDYLTQYSGVTASLLAGVRTRLSDARTALGGLVAPDDILVGHSLENDLRALRLAHARLLDTAALFPHPAGPPRRSSLKFLAHRYLGRAIQGGTAGHDSAEDAAAAMQLVQLKIANGALFGVERKGRAANLFVQLAGAAGDAAGPGARCTMLSDASSLRAYVAGSASAVRTEPGRWPEAVAATARVLGSYARGPVGGGGQPGLVMLELRAGAQDGGGSGSGSGTAEALGASVAGVRAAMAPNSLLVLLTQPPLAPAGDEAGTKAAMVGTAMIEVVARVAPAARADGGGV